MFWMCHVLFKFPTFLMDFNLVQYIALSEGTTWRISLFFWLGLVHTVIFHSEKAEPTKPNGCGDTWCEASPSQKYMLVGPNHNFRFVWEILGQKCPFWCITFQPKGLNFWAIGYGFIEVLLTTMYILGPFWLMGLLVLLFKVFKSRKFVGLIWEMARYLVWLVMYRFYLTAPLASL